jgi:hypothetical protein
MPQYQSGEIEPVHLTLADVLELHALIIGATAAEAADQRRKPTTRTQIWRSRLDSCEPSAHH